MWPFRRSTRKQNPKQYSFHKESKAGVDVLDQMSGCYSVKADSMHWPPCVLQSNKHGTYEWLDYL